MEFGQKRLTKTMQTSDNHYVRLLRPDDSSLGMVRRSALAHSLLAFSHTVLL
jgi:hypothetical protein